MTSTIRKVTMTGLSIFAFILSVLFILTSAQVFDFRPYFFSVIAVMLGVVIILEAGINQYFTKSIQRKYTLNDFINIVSAMFGAAVIVQGLLFAPILEANVPSNVLTSFGIVGIIVGAGAGIFAIVHMFKRD